VKLWVSYLTSLGLNLLICRRGVKIGPPPWARAFELMFRVRGQFGLGVSFSVRIHVGVPVLFKVRFRVRLSFSVQIRFRICFILGISFSVRVHVWV